MLYFGGRLLRKRVLKQNPNKVSWAKRGFRWVGAKLGLSTFIAGGEKATATEAKEQEIRSQKKEMASGGNPLGGRSTTMAPGSPGISLHRLRPGP